MNYQIILAFSLIIGSTICSPKRKPDRPSQSSSIELSEATRLPKGTSTSQEFANLIAIRSQSRLGELFRQAEKDKMPGYPMPYQPSFSSSKRPKSSSKVDLIQEGLNAKPSPNGIKNFTDDPGSVGEIMPLVVGACPQTEADKGGNARQFPVERADKPDSDIAEDSDDIAWVGPARLKKIKGPWSPQGASF